MCYYVIVCYILYGILYDHVLHVMTYYIMLHHIITSPARPRRSRPSPGSPRRRPGGRPSVFLCIYICYVFKTIWVLLTFHLFIVMHYMYAYIHIYMYTLVSLFMLTLLDRPSQSRFSNFINIVYYV